jgi:hypothetical protein
MKKDGEEQGKSKAAIGVSTECFGGDAGRPLVAVDHSGHDAVRSADLQNISEVL